MTTIERQIFAILFDYDSFFAEDNKLQNVIELDRIERVQKVSQILKEHIEKAYEAGYDRLQQSLNDVAEGKFSDNIPINHKKKYLKDNGIV
jgi:hypothetical protein